MRYTKLLIKGLLLIAIPFVFVGECRTQVLKETPPFGGTIFLDPDIILPDDLTSFEGLVYMGEDFRTMFDRRVDNWINVKAFLFEASFDDGLKAEMRVNTEFGSVDIARDEAEKHAIAIGQLPGALRAKVESVSMHKGIEPFGGGIRNILIHTGQSELYIIDGILEEILVHEAAHTSLDSANSESSGWLLAQEQDNNFISTYARDFPVREDIAESFLPYLAVRFRSDRISESSRETILMTMPNRITYFDNLSLEMYPVVAKGTGFNNPETGLNPGNGSLFQNYPNPFHSRTNISYRLLKEIFVELKIYTATGQELQVLISRTQQAGRYTVQFDGSNLPPGVYYYTLKVGSRQIETRKMAIVLS